MTMKLRGQYPNDALHQRDHRDAVNEFNRWNDNPVVFAVAVAGTEVAVSHGLDAIPQLSTQVATETANGTGVVYPGTTPWTTTQAFLTATVSGTYAVMFRRKPYGQQVGP